MKIDREETLRRMEAAAPSKEELAGREAVDLENLDDAGLILIYGTLLRARRDRELDLSDFEAEIRRRAAVYLMEMLKRENLLVTKEEADHED